MNTLSIPEAALIGPGVDSTPGVGPSAGEQGHPLSVPVAPIADQTPAPEHGPSTASSLYNYPYPYKG